MRRTFKGVAWMNGMTMKKGRWIHPVFMSCVLAAMIGLLSGCSTTGWQARLKQELPKLGHRNWIVVADSAYPQHNTSGIETLVTGKDQLEVLEIVLAEIGKTPHVRPVVLLDQELDFVPEAEEPGMTAYRTSLRALLKDKTVRVEPHEAILGRLDRTSQMFNVLLLKTTMTLPYTSVFLELDCAYWNPDQEKRLRQALK